jgi:hypothetical protein
MACQWEVTRISPLKTRDNFAFSAQIWNSSTNNETTSLHNRRPYKTIQSRLKLIIIVCVSLFFVISIADNTTNFVRLLASYVTFNMYLNISTNFYLAGIDELGYPFDISVALFAHRYFYKMTLILSTLCVKRITYSIVGVCGTHYWCSRRWKLR